MALMNPHHESERDFGGSILDICMLIAAIALFLGAAYSMVVLMG